tara:strand:- start:1375 stop:1638 length:264 start_codon:yes stop_codon:yes gene_type:complete
MQEEYLQVDTVVLMKTTDLYSNSRSRLSILRMNLANIERKTDLKAEVIINSTTQLVKHLNKSLKSSGLMPKTKSLLTKEEMKKLNKL